MSFQRVNLIHLGGDVRSAHHAMVSYVLPVHNERATLAGLFREIAAAHGQEPFEIVAVDDGSTDGSGAELRRLADGDSRIRMVTLPQNRGQSAALLAGCASARGDVVVTLDADGQNDPADAPRLVGRLARAPEVAAVVGVRVRRHDSAWKRLQSRVANAVRDAITGDRVRDTGCGLKAIRRDVYLTLPAFDGMHRFLPTLIRRQGGLVEELPVRHRPRWHGRSKYGMVNRAFRGLVDALGVRWLWRRRLPDDVGRTGPSAARDVT